ncbi:MAG: tRNA pseudouridine(13) synthase TruD [Archaeoglobaceae archaeon]|nr:tRNA pseudouridine(13) synthase TruD [Archaeoglobaceae archaeon]
MVYEKVGILRFMTNKNGIGGRIKQDAEDFFVNEIANIDLNEGNYLIIKVKKKNWDTMNLARVLSNILGISQKRIYYAGTKDKRAIAIQYFSIKNANEEIVEKLKSSRLRDVEIEIVGKSRKAVNLGNLLGNEFSIKIVDVNTNEIEEKIEAIKRELMDKGTPNFFGLQRFGSIRYITHEVGKMIVKGRFKDAFWIYVAKPFEGESKEVKKIREELWNTKDEKFGLRELPKHLRYERLLLQKLREGKDEEEALLSLPKNLKMMFVHAYQSYIFNLLLSERIAEFESLKKIEDEDIVSFVSFKQNKKRYYFFKEDYSIVKSNTKRRIKFLIDKRRAALALPLPGYETKVEGWCKEKLNEILEKEEVKLKDFKNKYKEFSSKGSFRSADILAEWTNLSYEIEKNDVKFNFYLPKGCYATIFLREFTKN